MPTPDLGRLIQQSRNTWNLTINDFTALTNISRATYNRIINNTARLSVTELNQIMATLAITVNELNTVVEEDDTNLVAFLRQLLNQSDPTAAISYLGAATHAAAVTHVQKMTAASGDTPGLRQLTSLLVCLNAQQPLAVRQSHAQSLFAEIATYSAWSEFELMLFIEIAPLLTFAQCHQAIIQFFSADMRTSPTDRTYSFNTTASPVDTHFVRLCYTLIIKAITTGSTSALAVVTDWIINIRKRLNQLEPWVLQQLAQILQDTDNNASAFTTAFQELMNQLTLLGLTEQKQLFIMLRDIQQHFLHALPLTATEQPHMQSDVQSVQLGHNLQDLRQQKRISTEQIIQDIGITYATYHRIEQQPQTADAYLVLQIMNYLRVSVFDTDIFQFNSFYNLNSQLHELANSVLSGQRQLVELTMFVRSLTTTVKITPTPPLQILLLVAKIMVASLENNDAKATQARDEIMAQCIKSPSWGAWLSEIAIAALEESPFAITKPLLTRDLRKLKPESKQSFASDFNYRRLLVLTLIKSACQVNPRVDLLEVERLTQSLFTNSESLDILMIQPLIHCALRYANGMTKEATHTVNQIWTASTTFLKLENNRPLVLLQNWWQELCAAIDSTSSSDH